MKLFYYRGDYGRRNFGDELNPWLWAEALPGVLNDYSDVVFLGIGTILTKDQLPKAHLRVVFGSGADGGNDVPAIDETWRIFCVRGPLTAKALGLAPELAVTDPGLLAARFRAPRQKKTRRLAYMPHWVQALSGGTDWAGVCGELGIGYIDPCRPVAEVLDEISRTEVLLAEALHGAVVADALRVPWIPVRTSPRILGFKWRDWQLSLGVERGFEEISGLIDAPVASERDPAGAGRWLKKTLGAAFPAARGINFRPALRQMRRIANAARPALSDAAVSAALGDRLEEGLVRLKAEAAAGCY